jgi:catechol-2,3-dioxygenase
VQIRQLGHAVLKVRDLERSEAFYSGVLGLPVAARLERPAMTFFTLGNHHDFALMQVAADAPDANSSAPGLLHVAFRVGDTTDELRAVKDELDAAGVTIDSVTDHTVTHSIYLRDPDGNGLELYVDVSGAWRDDPQLVASIAPLQL